MKKLYFALLMLATTTVLSAPVSAQTINSLGAGSTVSSTDIFPAYQGASPAKGVTAAQLTTFVNSLGGYACTTFFSSMSGPSSAANTCQYATFSVNGTQGNSTAYAPFYVGVGDAINANTLSATNFNYLFNSAYNLNTGFSGNRIMRNDSMTITGSPRSDDPSVHNYTVDVALLNPQANAGGTDTNWVDSNGFAWSGNWNVFMSSGATNWNWVGPELDVSVRTGASAVDVHNLTLVRPANHAVPGVLDDTFLRLGSASGAAAVRNGVEFGGAATTWPFDNTSTLIASIQSWAPTLVSPVAANYGIDFRSAAFNTGAIATPNGGIDKDGAVFGHGLVTDGNLTVQTATLTSITIGAFGGVTGGSFFSSATFPTLSISAPPSGGTQAVATVAHMKLTKALYVSGGTGCTNGDVLTLTGGTGTQSTITLTVGGGLVTGAAITTSGSYTAVSATPSTTGGTCSVQPTFRFGYGIVDFTISNAGAGYPAYPLPLIQASGYNNGRTTTAALTAGMTVVSAPVISSTLPTLGSGWGTTPGAVVTSTGTAAFSFTAGTAPAITANFNLPTAKNGWYCTAADQTAPSGHLIRQIAYTTTQATMGIYNATGTGNAPVAADIIVAGCTAF